MRVKVRDMYYDSEVEPIMLVLTEKDKKCIAKMDKKSKKFCACPRKMERVNVKEFMEIKGD